MEAIINNTDVKGIIFVYDIFMNKEDIKKEDFDFLGSCKRGKSDSNPTPLSSADKELIKKTAKDFMKMLEGNYQKGFGVFPSSGKDENFYEQLWTRDFSHATLNYLAKYKPEAVKDSLETIFKYQKDNGMLPLMVEKQYMVLRLVPGLRWLAKPLFNLIESGIRKRKERPVYEGQNFSSAEDTVPETLAAAGELYTASEDGKKFVEENFEKMEKAAKYFYDSKVDPNDSLASFKNKNSDWADSINRGGKLGLVNIRWARALHFMWLIASDLGKEKETAFYRNQYTAIYSSILDKIFNEKEAYFRAAEGEDRMDTVASIFGSLYFLDAPECLRVQETIKKRVKVKSGLQNFYPKYPQDQIMWPHKIINLEGYHNEYVWPWVFCENILAKIKIAACYSNGDLKERYKREVLYDLLDMAKMFDGAGGAYEIFFPDAPKPAISRWYKPPQNIMYSLVSYCGAYLKAKELDWI